MGIDTVLSIIGGAMMVVVLGLGALMFVNGSYNKARTMALREDNDDLRKRVDDQDKAILKHEAKEEAYEARLTALESENQLLSNMVTQRADVQTVMQVLNDHHNASMEAWTSIRSAIERTA